MILTTHSYFLNHDAKQLARMTPYSPLSTLIATALLRNNGHDVQHFDSTFAEDVADFERALDCFRPTLVAIMEDTFNFLTKMCTMRRRDDALDMIKAASKRGCRVVVNGPDSTDQPTLYLRAGAEAVLMAEGESSLVEIADLWRSDPAASLGDVAGLALADEHGRVWRTRARRHETALDKLPFPAWSYLDAGQYRSAWLGKHGYFSWNIATSRGCPYACNWCSKPTFGRGYEQRSPRSVATEVRMLKDTVAPDHIWFADDIFGLTTEWLQQYAEAAIELDARIPFTMQSRVNLMQPGAVDALLEAGAREVWLGVESGSQKILDAMEKGSRVDMARRATRTLKSRGIRSCWFIQLGYPGESWDDLCLTRELIREEQPDDIGVSVAYPLPGTRFHELVRIQMRERQNWESSDDLAMLFEGTYDTKFYRAVRDALHDEVRAGHPDDCRWARLGHDAQKHRSLNPILLATGS